MRLLLFISLGKSSGKSLGKSRHDGNVLDANMAALQQEVCS